MDMNRFVHALEKQAGPVSLAVTLGTVDNPTSMLNLLVSAGSLDHTSTKDAVKFIAQMLKTESAIDIQKSIARITVLPTTDALVLAINAMFNVQEGPVSFSRCYLNDVFVEHGVVYRSQSFSKVAQPG